MKREFKKFFTRKYILTILPILIIIIILGWNETFFGGNKSDSSVYSDFINGIKPYDTREELEELYDSVFFTTEYPGMEITYNQKKNNFIKSVYGLCLEKNLPYDSVTEMGNFKYTQFHFFSYFCIYMCNFILLSAIIIGSFYQTSDFLNKTAKLVYTSGEKRTKIVARKYCVSLFSLAVIVALIDAIFAFAGLKLSFTGAKYCVIFADGTLYYMNYLSFVTLNIFSHLLMLITVYTFVYYFAALIKNGIIASCAFLSITTILLFLGTSAQESAQAIFTAMFTEGLAAAITFRPISTLKYIALYTPFVLSAAIMATVTNLRLKHSDYSR